VTLVFNVVFVTALARRISPPSSPEDAVLINAPADEISPVVEVKVVPAIAAAVVPPITALSIVPPETVGELIVGDVKVLFVRVCEPVRVTTEESMAMVTALLPLYEVPERPVPIVRVDGVTLKDFIALEAFLKYSFSSA